MNHFPKPIRPNLNAFACAAQVTVRIGHLLLVLVAVSSITMPLTQHIWTFDRFLHGGQDFEFTVLVILTSLCLALLLVEHCRQSVTLLLTIWHLHSSRFNIRQLASCMRVRTTSAFDAEHLFDPVPEMQFLPLLI